jgi:HPt (histidine-containing phosphotransfer) domain-containing protein
VAKPIDTEVLLRVICKYLPRESGVSGDESDSAGSEVEQLAQQSCDCVSQGELGSEPSQNNSNGQVIDWTDLTARCLGADGHIKEVVEAFLMDSPAHMKALHEAIKAGKAADVRRHAHAVKGSAVTIGAKYLVEAAYRLEFAARRQKLEKAELFLANMQAEYEKLKSFLSQPDWIEIAKEQQEHRQAEQLETK